jgi:hypothetical protein
VTGGFLLGDEVKVSIDISAIKAEWMSEPGLDLHEWETRWAELQEPAEAHPTRRCPEIVRAVA